MKKTNDSNKLALHMLIAMVAGIGVGLVFMGIRESLGADSATWTTINNILFQDITAAGAEKSLGLFYLLGQLFIRALQLIIVPMVFSWEVLEEKGDACTLRATLSAKQNEYLNPDHFVKGLMTKCPEIDTWLVKRISINFKEVK